MHKDITLVIVDTTANKETSKRTIEFCQDIFPCKEAIIFTETPIDTKVVNVNNIYINSLEGYSSFLLSKVSDYITTSHYIHMQADGYILNPSAWTDDYLNYDYIGAPWAHHPAHYWPPHTPVGPNNSVGNGGFSLRSTKLAKMVQKVFIHLSKYTKDFTPDRWKLEDCFMCRDVRPWLEQEGCKFAPEDIASGFSCENKVYTDQFGFHGKETMKINKIEYL